MDKYDYDQEKSDRLARCQRDEYTGEIYFNGKWFADYSEASEEYDRLEDIKCKNEW